MSAGLRCYECEGAATVDVCDSYECGGGRDVCFAVRKKGKHGMWKYNRECGYLRNKNWFYKECGEEPDCKLYSCASDNCNGYDLHLFNVLS